MKKNAEISYWTLQGNKLFFLVISLYFLVFPVMAQNQTSVPSQNYIYFTAFGFIIGAVLSGIFNFLISKKINERTMRMGYLSNILSFKENIDELHLIFSEIHTRKNNGSTKLNDTDLLFELKKSRIILLFSLSMNHYDRLVENIKEKKWDKSEQIILEYISGNW